MCFFLQRLGVASLGVAGELASMHLCLITFKHSVRTVDFRELVAKLFPLFSGELGQSLQFYSGVVLS